MKFDLGRYLFSIRSYTPLPFLVLMVVFAEPTFWSVLIGFCMAVAGESLRFWGVSIAGSETRNTDKVGGSRLVISGPYAYVRNPLYVGNLLIYSGLGVMAHALSPWLLIIALAFFIFQYYMIVLGEEKFLEDKFGGECRAFYDNVPRFLPRVRPWKNDLQNGQTADFLRGFRSERRTLQAIAIVGLVIITRWMIG